MQSLKPIACLILGTSLSIFSFDSVSAQTAQQRAAIEKVNAMMLQAGQQYSSKKYSDCAATVKRIQVDIETLTISGDARVIRALRPTYTRLQKAHSLLELEGYSLPALKPLNPPKGKPGMPPTGVSFSKTIAPILVNNCGRCHVNQARGRFSMATYPALMSGPNNNRVIFPGDASGSRLIEVLEDGEMPPNGKIKDDDLAALKKWIAEGAKSDAEDATANLNEIARAADPDGTPAPEAKVVKSTGKETISFAFDIAPIFVTNCNGCHYDIQNNARGGLNVSTFRQLIRGGDTGQAIVQGKPAESLLLKRLKGEGGTRMPAGRPPLKDDELAKIEKWILEGATFDATDDREDIKPIYELAKATRSTHEELMSERLVSSKRNWTLFMPGTPPNKVETDSFVIYGDMSESVLQSYAKLAEKISPKIKRTFLGQNGPLVKGRVTLFLFKQRYDYSEFGKMVEKRDIPKGWKGHFRYDVINAYGAIILPRNDDEYSEEALFAQQISGVLVASLGKNTPSWFSEGAARVVAKKLDPKDPRIDQWKEKLGMIAAKIQTGDEFVRGQLPPEDTALAGYAFVQFLMNNRSAFTNLIKALRDGNDFEKAFSVIYRGTPSEVAKKWMGKGRGN
ncbi:MAG: hypothetical protein P8M80_02550 [Pirellulaceae bacterium]|nr:hypothetical protein [Pirellulaceae bacterium]